MKKKTTRIKSTTASLLAAVVAFIALSFFANGLVEVSSDVSALIWLRDILVYGVGYKLIYKLAASAVVAFIAYFTAEMLAYHHTRNLHRLEKKPTDVRFTPSNTGASKIA